MNAQSLLEVGVTQLWQVTAVIVLAIVFTSTVARRRPHLAYAVWLLVLIKCITPPLWSSPAGVFSWMRAERPAVMRAAEPVLSIESADWVPAPVNGVAAQGTAHVAANVERSTISTSAVICGVWALGSLVVMVIAVTRSIALRRVIEQQRVETPSVTFAIFDELRESLGVRSRVRLVVTSHPIGPALIGVLRPMVVIPQSIASARELRMILAHELMHLQRFDHVVAFLQTIALAAWWFHPLVWWMSRSITRVRELCCDEQTITELNCEPAGYLQMLIDLARSRRASAGLGVSAMKVTQRRVEHLMDHTTKFQRRTPRFYWLAMLIAGALLLPGEGLAVRQSQPAAQPAGAAEPSPQGVGRLIGTVIDKSTDKPVAGATLRFFRIHIDGGVHDQLGETRTHDRGEYDFMLPPGPIGGKDGVEIRVEHPEFASRYKIAGLQFRHGENPEKKDTIELLPGEEVTGVVHDPDGKPLPDCEVEFRSMVGPIDRIYLQSQPELTMGRVTTDAAGRYRFNQLKGATFTAAAIRPLEFAIARQSFRDPRRNIDVGRDAGVLRLERGQRITGRIVDEQDKPIGGMRVGVSAAMGGSRDDVTDPDGHFTLAPLAPGRYDLRVDDPRFIPLWVELKDAPHEPITIRHAEMVTIRGEVVDSAGRPVKYREIQFQGFRGDSTYWHHATEDGEGLFELRVPKGLEKGSLSPSIADMRALKWRVGNGEVQHGRRVELGTVDVDLADLTVVAMREATLEVKVIDAGGQAVEGAALQIQYASEALRMPKTNSWMNGSKGDAPVETVAPGNSMVHGLYPDAEFTLSIGADGFAPHSQTLSVKEGDKPSIEVKLNRSGAR